MAVDGVYEPSPKGWVRQQVEAYESSGGTRGLTLNGKPVVVMTMRGAKSGKVRKTPVMRVEHDGRYAVVASNGGSRKHPLWYANLLADPHIHLQDKTEHFDMTVREVKGAERADWWRRALDVWPPYDDYQRKTDREIPVLVLEPT
ncbi:MAG: nitroreductase family deazaflavin-dependent oxidoreductase [Candidatus Nanopelagicales bacterium]